MASSRPLGGSVDVLGLRLPIVIALIGGATLAATVAGSIGMRTGSFGLFGYGVLVPALVAAAQVWRLVTWVFFEGAALSLIFGLAALYWFGSELSYYWGARRFLIGYLLLAASAALGTCLVGLAWAEVWQSPHFGMWPVVDALIIAWGTVYPHRDIRLYFVIPVRGRHLVNAVILGTVLFALIEGVARFVPHLLAELIMLAYLRGVPLRDWWLRLRYATATRGIRRRSSHLRPVDRIRSDEPPRWLH